MKGRGLIVAALIAAVYGCSTGQRLARFGGEYPSLAVAEDVSPMDMIPVEIYARDTMTVTDSDGRTILIMRAVKDEDGELVATDRIEAATVTALFKNVAERNGYVDLQFDINVPRIMIDSRWQMRLNPSLHILDSTFIMDPVIITGERYRREQLRGYQQYERFLESIITDSSLFVRKRDLELFLSRNFPAVYETRRDSSLLSDDAFVSLFGVSGKEAGEHYTHKLMRLANDRRIASREKMYRKYVKVPIRVSGMRLDTIIDASSSFTYRYTQTIKVRPRLRKASISLSGAIFEEDRNIYVIPNSDSIDFYISSLSTMVDNTEKFLTRIEERRVSDNSVCWIDFKSGSATLDADMGNNASEIGRIKGNISELLENEKFDLDSIVVTASASPEGMYSMNARLAQRRSAAVSSYFDKYVRAWRDSVSLSRGVMMSMEGPLEADSGPDIRFIPHSVPENWAMLGSLIRSDTLISDNDKLDYESLLSIADPDKREKALSTKPFYGYLRRSVYPRLRTVRFDFFLHRKDMEKDTVHTTVLDTSYMRAVQLIRERDYAGALKILRPYADYNTALAYCSMDYNASAISVLENLERTPRVNYLLAVLYSRIGRLRDAAECYIRACELDPSLVHRGNLDPEISSLVKQYSLEQKLYQLNTAL